MGEFPEYQGFASDSFRLLKKQGRNAVVIHFREENGNDVHFIQVSIE